MYTIPPEKNDNYKHSEYSKKVFGYRTQTNSAGYYGQAGCQENRPLDTYIIFSVDVTYV